MEKKGFFIQIKQYLKEYFDLKAELDDEKTAVEAVMDGVSFKGANIIILILAIFIASLGLNTNSAAVIIGAMLISPLMGPIIGMGFGLGIYDFDLIKRSFRNLAIAAAFSVLASTVYFLISPVSEGRSELLARTSPSIYDVLIGFFGGLAGIVALACRKKGNVIPGVAIATALMPPLCTAGYGLATWQLQYFFGAFYLFLINSIFIGYATTVGVKFLGFKQRTFVHETTKHKVKKYVTTIIIVTLLPSIWLTFSMIRDSYFENSANNFINTEFVFPNTQVLNKDAGVKNGKKFIHVTLIGERLNTDSLHIAMMKKIDGNRWLRGTELTIQQGVAIGTANPLSSREITASMFNEIYADNQKKIAIQAEQIDSLIRCITMETEFENLSRQLAPEIKVLFPKVKDIALSKNVFCSINEQKTDTVNLAIVEVNGFMPANEMKKFESYIEVRSGVSPIKIVKSEVIGVRY
ncbi:MAG: TIGR00341 family protein [Muribaculaceae bacterium]|nr:TIGR00341 family protein [Muribaculaceae bacterium]